MRIEELTGLKPIVEKWKQTNDARVLYLSTEPEAEPILKVLAGTKASRELLLLVGPEGGLSDTELESLEASGAIGVKLTRTVLRVETAAIAGAVAAQLFVTSHRAALFEPEREGDAPAEPNPDTKTPARQEPRPPGY